MQGVRLAGTWSLVGVVSILFVYAPFGAEAAVGVTRGAPGVSPTGTATYEIPLTLPPGTNGLTPRLSLRYSHTQGSGIFGVGWSLTGLSAIVRCNKTYAQDGAPSAATLATSDGYCLDGNRLRLTADGILRSCLFEGGEVDVRSILRNAPRSHERKLVVAQAMTDCVRLKPDVHTMHGNQQMSRIGG